MMGNIKNAKVIRIRNNKEFIMNYERIISEGYTYFGMERVATETFKKEFRKIGSVIDIIFEIYYANDLVVLEELLETDIHRFIFAKPPIKAFIHRRLTDRNVEDKLIGLTIRVMFDKDWVEELELEGSRLRDFIISDPILSPDFFREATKKEKILKSRR